MTSYSFAVIFYADKGKPIPVQAWTGSECSRQMILCGWIIHIAHVRRWEGARRSRGRRPERYTLRRLLFFEPYVGMKVFVHNLVLLKMAD